MDLGDEGDGLDDEAIWDCMCETIASPAVRLSSKAFVPAASLVPSPILLDAQ
jgi:hypothetical protein